MTEDLQTPTHSYGLPRDKAIVDHRGFGSYSICIVIFDKSSHQLTKASPSMLQESCMIASLFSRTKELNFSFFFYQ